MRLPDAKFKWHLWLAQYLGLYKYDGLLLMAPPEYPRARIMYSRPNWPGRADDPDRFVVSIEMPIGNAVEYATMFGGEVIPVDYFSQGDKP